MSSVIGPNFLTAHLAMKHPVLAACVVSTALLSWSDADPDKGYVLFTFDDGYVSDYTTAYPMLLDAGFPATYYLTSGNIGQPGFMNWQHINLLHEWEQGSHTITHPDLTELPENQMASEIGIATEVQQTFASPYGYFGDREIEAIKRAGYKAHVNAWSEENGVNQLPIADPFNIHRITVRSDMTSEYICNMAPEPDQAFVMVFHAILPEDQITSEWQVSEEMLQEIIDCFEGYNSTTISKLVDLGQEVK